MSGDMKNRPPWQRQALTPPEGGGIASEDKGKVLRWRTILKPIRQEEETPEV
jgi:hypothetical protein